MDKTPPSTRERIRLSYRRSLLWTTLSTMLMFGIADVNAPFTILALLGVTAAWAISVRPQSPIARPSVNIALVLVLTLAAAVTLRIGIGVSTFAIFASMLLIVKLFDLRADDGQVVVLLISLFIAGVLTSNSMLTGVMMFVVGILLMRTVVRFHLYAVAFQAGEHATLPELSSRGRVDLRSFQSATLFLAALVGTAVFLVLPRNLGVSSFGDWGAARQNASVTGFTDEVELGRPGLISQSATPVLDMEIYDRNERNVGEPNSRAIYLRGAVLTEYDHGRWEADTARPGAMIHMQTLPPNTPVRPTRIPTQQDWQREYRISLRQSRGREKAIFLPWMPTEFRVMGSRARIGYEMTSGRILHDSNGSVLNYRVRVINPEMLAVDPPEEGTPRRAIDRTGISDRIAELSAQIVRDAGLDPDPETRPWADDLGAVRVIEKYLQAKYAYTLTGEPVPPGRDATEWFLFDRRQGHCEYYASALALMTRSLGIDARVITGYVASDFNGVTGQYLVRESNAHAWVEAEVLPDKWMTFDGTPRADFQQIHERKPGLFRTVSRWYETIEYAWVKGVVGYDASSRRKVFGDLSGDLGMMKFAMRMRERFDHGRSELIGRATLIAGIVFGATFFAGLLVLRYRVVLAGLLAPIEALLDRLHGFFGGRGLSDEERLASRLELAIDRSLRGEGYERPGWLPLRSALDELEVAGAVPGPLRRAGELLYRIRFAPPERMPESGEVDGVLAELRASEKPGDRRKTGRARAVRAGRP